MTSSLRFDVLFPLPSLFFYNIVSLLLSDSIFCDIADEVVFNEQIDRPPMELAKPRKAKQKEHNVCA